MLNKVRPGNGTNLLAPEWAEIQSIASSWPTRTHNILPGCRRSMNWESERDMKRDVEENPDLYAALADENDDE